MSGREAFIDTNIALYLLKVDSEVFEMLRENRLRPQRCKCCGANDAGN